MGDTYKGLQLPGPVPGELIEWEFPDPANWGIDGVRDLRDRVQASVRRLSQEARN